MAITHVFSDGFDIYDSTGLLNNAPWTTPGTNTAIDTGGVLSRSGLGCLKIVSSAFGPSLTLPAHEAQMIVTGAVNLQNQLPSGGNSGSLFRCIDNFDGVVQVRLDVNADLSVSVYNGNSPFPTLLGTSAPNVMLSNAYNFIAMRFLVATSGSVRVWINGNIVLDLTGVVTQFPGKGAFVDTIQLFAFGGTTTWLWDDVAFYTWTDVVADQFPFAPPVLPALGVSDSTPLQFTPSTGLTHFNLVNGVPEQTTTYVSDGTVGNIDQYIHAIPVNQQKNLPTNPSVLAIYHVMLAEMDAAGTRSFGSSKNGAAAPTSFPLSTSFVYYGQPYTPGLAHYTDLPSTPFGPEVTA